MPFHIVFYLAIEVDWLFYIDLFPWICLILISLSPPSPILFYVCVVLREKQWTLKVVTCYWSTELKFQSTHILIWAHHCQGQIIISISLLISATWSRNGISKLCSLGPDLRWKLPVLNCDVSHEYLIHVLHLPSFLITLQVFYYFF